jgi:REP element-mobilizing transposase RayT
MGPGRAPNLTFRSPKKKAGFEVILKYNYLMDGYKFLDGVFVYYVTFTITDWLPIFINSVPIHILTDSLRFCILEKYLRIHAYVIMPNHIHLIVFDANFDNDRLQKTLTEFRKFTGSRLAKYINNSLADSLSAVIRIKSLNDRARQVWQRGWHAEGLASDNFLHQKMNYIHENPVRKGLVRNPEDWIYSSASFWINGDEGEIPVVPIEEE